MVLFSKASISLLLVGSIYAGGVVCLVQFNNPNPNSVVSETIEVVENHDLEKINDFLSDVNTFIRVNKAKPVLLPKTSKNIYNTTTKQCSEIKHLSSQKNALENNVQQLNNNIYEFKHEFQLFLQDFKKYGKYVRIKYHNQTYWQDIPIKNLVLANLPKVDLPVKIKEVVHTSWPVNDGIGVFYNLKPDTGYLHYISFINDPLHHGDYNSYNKLREHDDRLKHLFSTLQQSRKNISQHVHSVKTIMDAMKNV